MPGSNSALAAMAAKTLTSATALAIAFSHLPLWAQTVEIKPDPEAGDMVLTRDVPTRAGQKEGNGEALVANMAPGDVFSDALDLGISELDDADAARITSTALNGLARLSAVDEAATSSDALVAQTLRDNGITLFGDPSGSGAGSIVNGSVDAAISNANSATQAALGSLSDALGGLNTNGGGK